MWAKLKALYKSKGFSLDFLLCKELFNTTLDKCEKSVKQYLMRIIRLINDLKTRNITLLDKIIMA
jgi:hypothetical protein